MSGLLRNLYQSFYSENTKKYDDDTINLMMYNVSRTVKKPTSMNINFKLSPELIDMENMEIIRDSYPVDAKIDKSYYMNYPELVEQSKKEDITLDYYVKYVKNYIRKNDNYDFKKKIINPVEFKIKNTPVKFICRASYKLANIDFVFNIMENNNNFADLCGGPGGFSEYILYKYPNSSGLGMTLKSNNPELDWKIYNFRTEIKRERLVTTYGDNYVSGADNNVLNEADGNILNLVNIKSFIRQINKTNPDGVKLVVADGAAFEEDENELDSIEISHLKLFISESFLATQILKKGGNFVLKIFKTKYACTQTFIILLASLFEESYIFKPVTSRLNNSERYFIGKGFKYNPSDKIYFDFFKNCLEITNLENYVFFNINLITPELKKYFYETSLENLQRQLTFCHIYQVGYSYNWKNYISIKKLWYLLFNN
jgi:23S rRNA U2552 (ribose-2'-O)-methylase RlmE/FtsJ